MFWLLMRQAAVQRHWIFNQTLEGGCPERWHWHMAVIRAVYGW
jgi:hypothetical protein